MVRASSSARNSPRLAVMNSGPGLVSGESGDPGLVDSGQSVAGLPQGVTGVPCLPLRLERGKQGVERGQDVGALVGQGVQGVGGGDSGAQFLMGGARPRVHGPPQRIAVAGVDRRDRRQPGERPGGPRLKDRLQRGQGPSVC